MTKKYNGMTLKYDAILKLLDTEVMKYRKGLVFSGLVFLACFFLSFSVFIVLNSYANTFAQSEHNSVASNVTQSFIERLAKLEANFMNVAMKVRMNEGIAGSADAKNFKFVYRIYRSDGSWVKNDLFQSDAAPTQRITSGHIEKMLSNHRNMPSNEVVSIETFSSSPNEPPMLLFSFQMENNALIVAEPQISNLFGPGWAEQIRYVHAVALFQNGLGWPLWGMEFDNTQGHEVGYSKIFSFSSIGKDWHLKIVFKNDETLTFVNNIPWYFLTSGFVLSLLISLASLILSQKHFEILDKESTILDKERELGHVKSEQDLLRKMLEKSEQENRAIIDSVSDVIFETDTNGQIIFLNAAWRRVTGFDPTQFVGQDIFSMLHPQEQKYQKEDFSLLVKGQKQAYRSFTRLRTSDGNFRAVEIAMSMMRADKDGNLRVVGTFTDVEERRRAERALSEAEKKYRAIVENAAGGIYQVTPEGIYLSANPSMARILGYDNPEQILREVKNANMSVYVNPKDRAMFLREAEGDKDYKNYQAQVYRKDKTKIWVNENVRAVRDDAGNVLYYEGSIEDITERKESEIALNEAKMNSDLANRAKSEFLANMSHELRTPLNSIIGFSEMIKNEVLGRIEQRSYWEYAKDIHSSGKSLLKIINEILDISKIEAGNRQLNEEVIDLENIVFSCLDLMSTKIVNNSMHVINTLHKTPKVVGEAVAVKQIMMNLLSNAIKFTPSNGRVTISSEIDHHGQLRLSITDTGIGLEPHQLEKALSPFGQIDNELDREGSGTGLGLTLANSLMKLHDGRLDLLSQKGIGTTATLVFPVERVVLQKEEQETVAKIEEKSKETASDDQESSEPPKETLS